MKIKYSLNEIDKVAKQLLDYLKKNSSLKIIVFDGKMGSGKTTLIKEICIQMNVVDEVTSPTFAIINEYVTQDNQPVYHFDFYRLKNIQEAIDIGCEDYFYSGNYCFIEWANIVEPILPDNTLIISINQHSENQRILQLSI